MNDNIRPYHIEGTPVDLTPWAYTYRKGDPANPPETAWLWPRKFLRMEVVNGSMVWHYDDTPQDIPIQQVLCAFLWEEPRDIQTVEVEFPAGQPLPQPGELAAACRVVDSMWEDARPWKYDPHLTYFTPADPPVTSQAGGTVYHFVTTAERFTKLYVLYSGAQDLALPVVRACGAARWGKPFAVELEWGFQSGQAETVWDGRLEAYNGAAGAVEPLAKGNGLVVVGNSRWREDLPVSGRRGIVAQVQAVNGPANSRTLLTLETAGGSATMAVSDLQAGPVLIPSVGIFAALAGSDATARQFQLELDARAEKTIRQRVRVLPEQSLAKAMRDLFGERTLPDPPLPPHPSAVQIDVPDQLFTSQWRLGAWHLARWAMKLDDETYCVSIWPYDKGENLEVGVDGREGAAAIGAETYQILRTLDLLGSHDIAEGGLNYWLHGEHAVPFVWGAEVMGRDALTNPYNSPNHRSPGYDQKHSGGHGKIMEAAAFHYRLTGRDAWFEKARPVLERAWQATARVRQAWMDQLQAGMWCYGMVPPSNTGDGGDTRLYYYTNTCWFSGLKGLAEAFRQASSAVDPALEHELAQFRQALRRAAERSAALTPVVRVRDGSYRRFVAWQPYLRGSGIETETGLSAWYSGVVAGGLRLAPDIFGPGETLTQEMLDVYEDVLLSRDVSQPPTGEAWFTRSGINGQCGHEVQQINHLMNDDVALYLRTVFNGYAAEVEPDEEYKFWEGPLRAGAPDKTFEEAAFLERLRMLLVMEEGDDLWLARATPRAWLEQGQKIEVSNAPTFFGPASYTILSDVEHHQITARVEIPARNAPQAVLLRLRHPAAAPIQSVQVNDQPWADFDPARELVRLIGLSGVVTVQVVY